jgi:hypothetical protein
VNRFLKTPSPAVQQRQLKFKQLMRYSHSSQPFFLFLFYSQISFYTHNSRRTTIDFPLFSFDLHSLPILPIFLRMLSLAYCFANSAFFDYSCPSGGIGRHKGLWFAR